MVHFRDACAHVVRGTPSTLQGSDPHLGSSTSGADKTATKRSLRAKRELGPAAAAAHLQSTGGTVLRDMVTTRGRVPAMSASSGGQVLKQESRPERRHSDTTWMVLTKLRVNLGLTIATMAE